MRGPQRPVGPHWSTSLLVGALDVTAAQSVFSLLCGQPSNPDVEDLVRAVDCLPLSIRILGHLGQYQPAAFLLARYRSRGITMLRVGPDAGFPCLYDAIQRSFNSAIMAECPQAVEVLRKLAIVEQPIKRSECTRLLGHNTAIHGSTVSQYITAILQSSLAVIDSNHHIIVPSHIRDYISQELATS